MVEVGQIYRLNAPWHNRHGRLVLVVHSRKGVSPDYAGRTIYHVVDSDDFGGEPDWDTEYVAGQLSEYRFDVRLLFDNSVKARISALVNAIKETQSRFSNLKLPGLIQSRLVMSVSIKGGTSMVKTCGVILGAENFYTQIPDKFFSAEQIYNLSKYYDDNSNFIEQQPPN